MANKTKCSLCNIVLCELFAFVQNKHEVMDNESLIKICITSFSEFDIDEAKSLLFESIMVKQKKKSRRNDGKKQRDLENIINLFKQIDPEMIPIFAAKDLQKLPPISFDH